MQIAACPAEPSRASGNDALAQWRRAIRWGNRAFDEHDHPNAIAHYEMAVALADAMVGRIDDAEAGTAAWVVAHHNLADTYARMGRAGEQSRHLCAAHARLCEALAAAALPPRWQAAAQRHCRRTYAELTHYLARHPDDRAARAACECGAAGLVSTLTRQ